MKPFIKYLILIVAVLWGLYFPAYAQNVESVDSLPSRDVLLDKLQTLQQNFDSQKIQYEKQISTLENKLNRLKNKSELAKANAEILTLNNTIDSLVNVIEIDNKLISSLKDKCSVKDDSISMLTTELQSMLVFRKAYLLNLFKESDDYLKLPYSKIESDKLNFLKEKLSEYSTDKEVSKAIAKINDAIVYKEYVSDMEKAIANPYNRTKIVQARSSFTKLKNNKNVFSAAQWEEFDNLDKYLSRYKVSLATFQTIIEKNNAIISQYGGSSASSTLKDDCIDEIKEVFKPFEEREIGKGINVIPYLKTRFEKYRKWALSNPLNKSTEISTIESEIMTLKPTK